MPKEITVRMAKARPAELEAVKVFVAELEGMHYGSIPGIEDEESFKLTEEEIETKVGRWFMEWAQRHASGLSRVVWGFDTLLRNVCDEKKDYLDWKPEIAAALKVAGIDLGSDE